MDKSRKSTYIIAAVSLVIIVAAIYFLFIFDKTNTKKPLSQIASEDVKEASEIELENRPYVTLTPTADGAEIIISIENMSYFDKIEYELTYLADNPNISGDKIERGSTGYDVNTQDAKYKKSILLGTGSKGVRSPDKGVTDGTLSLHLFKGETEYLSETPWDLFQVGTRATSISKGNFSMQVPPLGKNYWVIAADTVGLPPTPQGFSASEVITPVFGAFSIAPEFPASAEVTITAEGESLSLFVFDTQESSWSEAKSTFSSGEITASVDKFSTFAVVSPK